MKKAIDSTIRAVATDGRAGVIWHTQGSGKSYSMTFLAGNLIKNPILKNPTIVVITDRNDLDGQLFSTFSGASEFLRQTPLQAESRQHVKELLEKEKREALFFPPFKNLKKKRASYLTAKILLSWWMKPTAPNTG